MDEDRKRLLIVLESIVGREFYNSRSQIWGPGGVFLGTGLDYRYPITLISGDATVKVKNIDPALPIDTIMTGSYRLGANQLNVMRAIDGILDYLERHCDLKSKVRNA